VKPLAITLGDPAGIGGEIVFKALETMDVPARVYGSRAFADPPKNVHFVDVGGKGAVRFGEISADYGRIALATLDAALRDIESGECSALVTAPIHKQSIALAGAAFPGHTELLAARAGLKRYGHDYAMYYDSPHLRAVLLTVHLSLKDAIAHVQAEDIAALARLTAREFARIYGRQPSIAVAGLNPHAGEGGQFGDEENEIVRAIGMSGTLDVTGPHSADTVFRRKCDVVLALYHDQALIPIKTMAFEESVNVTIGLPYLRVSVDHGTAFDIAGKGVANAAPMRYAIEWAVRHAEKFAR
jgi:4-hydroxythreonine-4-phosphate dehydrogenase